MDVFVLDQRKAHLQLHQVNQGATQVSPKRKEEESSLEKVVANALLSPIILSLSDQPDVPRVQQVRSSQGNQRHLVGKNVEILAPKVRPASREDCHVARASVRERK